MQFFFGLHPFFLYFPLARIKNPDHGGLLSISALDITRHFNFFALFVKYCIYS